MTKCRILKCGECTITQGYSSSHEANDIVARINGKNTTDYVVAHSSGKVIAIATGHKNQPGSSGMNSYGNYVQIQHSNGYTTFYAHLDSVNVKKGQTVSKGQTIGYMGNTGNSYGAHTHFEVRKGTAYSTLINPTPYLNADLPNTNKISAIYRVYCKGHWYAEVKDGATAGDSKNGIDGYQVKTTAGGGITKYKAHILGGKWLPEVRGYNETDDGYAGIKGKKIDAITMWSEHGDLTYRVKTKQCGWLPWIKGRYGTTNDSYAGNLGQEIIAVEIKVL